MVANNNDKLRCVPTQIKFCNVFCCFLVFPFSVFLAFSLAPFSLFSVCFVVFFLFFGVFFGVLFGVFE